MRELAYRKLELSENYNVAQVKRVLLKGIQELQAHWQLKAPADAQQFEKRGRGLWARFERKPKRKPIADLKPPPQVLLCPIDPTRLEFALTKRGIGPATANELSEQYPSQSVQTMIELFDWYNARGLLRGAGFLVSAIKNPQSIVLPLDFQNSGPRTERKPAPKVPSASTREFQTQRERQHHQREESRLQAFTAFWQGLPPQQQATFEAEAVDRADSTKRSGYYRSQGERGQLFKHYQTAILRDHDEHTQGANSCPEPKP